MEFENKSRNKTNRRIIYILAFTSIVLPVIVGVLVWHLTETSCSSSKLENIKGESDANTGNEQTTGPPNNATVSPPSVSEPWKNLRLPKHIIPIHYDITLYPDFYGDNGWFYGNESVEIQITADTHVILIHINYMNVTKTVLRNNSTRQMIHIKEPFFYEENQFWVVETQQPVKAGESVVLELQFDGSLTRAIVGFYKSSYVNSVTNQIRYLASSKFQPVDARRAFPCFDEPNFKAEYTVSLVHRKGYIALSNMPARDTVTWPEDSSLDVTHFQRSVKMSTYLACFIVCDFGYLEGETKFGTKVRTYATPDRVNQTAYSLDIAVHTMERFQELFGVPYPLPKQDMIAIPDFVSGAMEHWGLITYRETNMLYDENEASPANKQRVAVVVAHEISHQWFGNIVTMDWWDDLWLNEGFASFIEYVGTNSAEPAWDMMDQFVTEDVQPVMITDSAVSSHPIIVDVNHPNQINEVFDAISYSKGASVIRMLESVMGQEDFYRGIGNFLETFKWGNAKTDDLWQKLNEVNKANFDVKPMMDSWTRQMGLPFVNVTFGEQNGQPKVTATQHRFLADMEMKYNESESPFKYRWYINMDYQTNDGIKGMFWINQTQDTVTVDVPVNPDTVTNAWIKFNNNQTGFYRVNYPSDIWKNFATTLQSNVDAISKVDKAGLIDDAFNLARGGYIEYDSPLDLTIYLRKETSHLPWESAYNGMGYLTSMLQTVGTFAKWSQYILSICKPVMESVGWDDTDGHLKKLMRVNLISLTCGMGDEECLQNATRIFRDWLDNGKSIPPNTRSLAYKFGMQNGGTSNDWDQMWQKYKTETVPQEQIKLLYGMAHTRHVWLLVRFLEYSKDESMVRSQDFFTVLQYIARNPVGKPLVWDWIRANWEYLVTRFTTYSRSLGRLVPAVISGFNTEFHLKEVEEFFAKFPDAGAGERGRIQALESIKRNIAWMKRNEMPISDWLCRHMSTC